MLSMRALERARQRTLERIQRNNRLIEIYTLEKERLEVVINTALCVENSDNHWQEYERLKKMISQFVGFDAKRTELATCQHYEIMLDFIDWLLPTRSEMMEIE